MVNFADIVNKKINEIERPIPMPVGTYRWQITKLFSTETFTDRNGVEWDRIVFPVRAVEAMEDVDLSDFKGDIKNTQDRIVFLYNKQDPSEAEKTEFRIKQFLMKHVKCGDESMSLGEAMNASIGGQFLAGWTHQPDQNDPEILYGRIGKTAPLD